ncbi:hypothetical protein FB451DRAFT_1164016 [Mycena latifolia]|nr:hypothetical protein FB451DRAFT_1164016 [Mycena latifolia]
MPGPVLWFRVCRLVSLAEQFLILDDRYTTSFGVHQLNFNAIHKKKTVHLKHAQISTRGNTSPSRHLPPFRSVSALQVIPGGLFSGRLYDRGHLIRAERVYSYYQIFLAHGLGAGTVYVPSVTLVSHYFNKRRALAMAISITAASLRLPVPESAATVPESVIYAELTSWPIGIGRQRLTPVTIAGRWSANGDQRVTVAHDVQGCVPQNQWWPPDITGSALPGIPLVPSVSRRLP